VLDGAEQAAQMVNDLIDGARSQPVGGDREDAELVAKSLTALSAVRSSRFCRRLGFRAVWDFAPSGISRRSASGAVTAVRRFNSGRRLAYADAYSNGPTAMYWPE
jgi:hypothetical protein